ncbi:hypothetical protein ABMA28_006979 [Loxostege sticticalis]|uniref:Uncharacterized protein n=1 Tax=Loxostege sticticalis TaxID=481309 RepID=A0ABD0SR24_LOXSC
MEDCLDDVFPQYAQDPLENFTQQYKDLFGSQPTEVKQKKKRRVVSRRNKNVAQKSFVMCNEKKGIKLIQVRVLDLTCESDPVKGKTDSEGVLFSAQYVVHNSVDEIMDMTECVVKKISKKLCGDSF